MYKWTKLHYYACYNYKIIIIVFYSLLFIVIRTPVEYPLFISIGNNTFLCTRCLIEYSSVFPPKSQYQTSNHPTNKIHCSGVVFILDHSIWLWSSIEKTSSERFAFAWQWVICSVFWWCLPLFYKPFHPSFLDLLTATGRFPQRIENDQIIHFTICDF